MFDVDDLFFGLLDGGLASSSAPDLEIVLTIFSASGKFSPKGELSTYVFCSCSFISFIKEERMKLRLVMESLYCQSHKIRLVSIRERTPNL